MKKIPTVAHPLAQKHTIKEDQPSSQTNLKSHRGPFNPVLIIERDEI